MMHFMTLKCSTGRGKLYFRSSGGKYMYIHTIRSVGIANIPVSVGNGFKAVLYIQYCS